MRIRACVFGVTLLTFASLLGLQLAKAQTATGTIVGTVTDPKGLPIVEVSVVVRNQDTETESIFPTNAAGIYAAPYLQPGNYQVTASKSGFEIVVHKNVVVHVGDRLTIDVQLSLQTQQTSIIVTEEAPVLETGKTDQSQTVSQDQVEGLPIATRRWENFVLLTPAVTADGTPAASAASAEFPASITGTPWTEQITHKRFSRKRAGEPLSSPTSTAPTPLRNSKLAPAITVRNTARPLAAP